MLLSDVRSLRRHIRIYFLYMSLEITHYKKSTKTCWPQCSPVNMKITTYYMTTNLFASVLSKDSSYTAFLWQLSPLHHVPLRHNIIKIRLHCTTNYHLKCLKFCQQEQKHLHVVEEVEPKIYRIYIQYFFLKIFVFHSDRFLSDAWSIDLLSKMSRFKNISFFLWMCSHLIILTADRLSTKRKVINQFILLAGLTLSLF